MKDTVTLKELLAIVVRRGRGVIVFALVLAILLGSIQGVRKVAESNKEENSAANIERRYQEACVEYEETKAELEMQLARAQTALEEQRLRQDKGLLMKIDAYNMYTTSVHFAVSEIDMSGIQLFNGDEGAASSYILDRIMSQYKIYWDSVALEDVLQDTEYEEYDEACLREVVKLSEEEGGVFTLFVYGTSAGVTENVAEAVSLFLESTGETICETAAPHQLSVLNAGTKYGVNGAVEDAQQASTEKIESYKLEIETLTEQTDTLSSPQREAGYSFAAIIKSAIKYAVLGAVLGGVLMCVIVLVSYLFQNRVESSFQLEQGLEIPFLGSVAVAGNVWNRLANCILGERSWNDRGQALEYVSENVKAAAKEGEALLVATTLPALDEDLKKDLSECLREAGVTIQIVENAALNPVMVSALKTCGGVLLAERVRSSGCAAVSHVFEQSKAQKKSVYGFIMV